MPPEQTASRSGYYSSGQGVLNPESGMYIAPLLKLDSISLVQFKNYHQTAFTFDDRIVGIAGKNGVGKTNLLDAIYYCCFTKSYFARTDGQNVLKGAAGFRIEAHFTLAGEPMKVVCILRETGKKEFLLNDELMISFPTILAGSPA